LALVLAAPPASASNATGAATLVGTATMSPALGVVPAGTHYSLAGTLSGVLTLVNGAVVVPANFTATCLWAGNSVVASSIAAGAAGLSGSCNGSIWPLLPPTTPVGPIYMSCTTSRAASWAVWLVHADGTAHAQAECDVSILIPGVITVNCHADMAADGAFVVDPSGSSATVALSTNPMCTGSIP
jgi:hypothetical protein